MPPTKLGRMLKALREKREWTLEDLAKKAKVTMAYISLLERGQRQPSLISLFALCDALGVEPEAVIQRLKKNHT